MNEKYKNLLSHSNQFLQKHGYYKYDNQLFKEVKFSYHKKPQKLPIIFDKEKFLKDLYSNPLTKRNGRDSFYFNVRQKAANITRQEVFDFLKKQENYQLHLIQPREKILRPINETQINSRWCIDYIDMSKWKTFSGQKNNKSWILTIIDVFSKKAWAVATAQKSAEITAAELEKILQSNWAETGSYPKVIQSDNGKEFVNKSVKELMKAFDIKFIQIPPYMAQANSSVERFNRTLKNLIYSNNPVKWVENLDILTKNYNNSYHSSIKDVPNRIHSGKRYNLKQENIIKKNNEKFYSNNRTYPNLKIGDKVRIHILTDKLERKNKIFAKKYVPQWSKEIYKIEKITKGTKLKKRYTISHGRVKLTQNFYRHDLQKIF